MRWLFSILRNFKIIQFTSQPRVDPPAQVEDDKNWNRAGELVESARATRDRFDVGKWNSSIVPSDDFVSFHIGGKEFEVEHPIVTEASVEMDGGMAVTTLTVRAGQMIAK